jgi:hypothetical protein
MNRLLASLCCMLILPSIALADGPGPQRKMTEAEAAAYNNVTSTLQSALPKAPEGYVFGFDRVSDFDLGMLPEALKATDMFRMTFGATYTFDTATLGAERQMSSLMDRAKGTPEQQRQMNEINARGARLKEARDNTRDRAEKDKIRAELKIVREEEAKLNEQIMADYQAWAASGGADAVTKDIDQSLPPKEFSIKVVMNADISLNDNATPCTIPGASLAFEQSEGCQDFDTFCLTLFFGPYEKIKKVSGYTLYQLRNVDRGVPTKVRGIAITVGGPKDRPASVREFAQKIDLAKLKTLLP